MVQSDVEVRLLEKAVKVHATLTVELANQGAAEEAPPLDIEFLRRIQDACGLQSIGCFHLGFLGQIDVWFGSAGLPPCRPHSVNDNPPRLV